MWILEEVFECGCCGYFTVTGTNEDPPPCFTYEYDNRDQVLEQVKQKYPDAVMGA